MAAHDNLGDQFHFEDREYYADPDLTETHAMVQTPEGPDSRGYVRHSQWGDAINIDWIEASDKRQGVGRALMGELQRRHPSTPIASASYTPEGRKLFKGLKLPTHNIERYW